MGAVRAAAGRKARKEYRRSGDGRGGEPGPGVRVSAGRRHGDGRAGPRVRLQGANSSESLAGRDGKAISEVGLWAPERSRPSVAESDVGSAFSAPDVYGEDSFLIEDLVVRLAPDPHAIAMFTLAIVCKCDVLYACNLTRVCSA